MEILHEALKVSKKRTGKGGKTVVRIRQIIVPRELKNIPYNPSLCPILYQYLHGG